MLGPSVILLLEDSCHIAHEYLQGCPCCVCKMSIFRSALNDTFWGERQTSSNALSTEASLVLVMTWSHMQFCYCYTCTWLGVWYASHCGMVCGICLCVSLWGLLVSSCTVPFPMQLSLLVFQDEFMFSNIIQDSTNMLQKLDPLISCEH